jgi:hypothetical protein
MGGALDMRRLARTAIIKKRWHGRASWRRSKLHAYSDLSCGHTIDHGVIGARPLPLVGDRVTCRRCTRGTRRASDDRKTG